jgi:hypothetical protein
LNASGKAGLSAGPAGPRPVLTLPKQRPNAKIRSLVDFLVAALAT